MNSIKHKIRYFIDDEMVWAFAKDAMEAELARREEEIELLKKKMKGVDRLLGQLELKALDFYGDHLRHEYELRVQAYEKFLQWWRNSNLSPKEIAEEGYSNGDE